MKPMDIHTPPGSRVVFSNPDFGWPSDKWKLKGLEIGKNYTVEVIQIGAYTTRLYLVEFPKVEFNAINFSNVEDEGP